MRAVTSASNLHRRRKCPGSQRAEQAIPGESHATEISIKGDQLHEVMAGKRTADTMDLHSQDLIVSFEILRDEALVTVFGEEWREVEKIYEMDLQGNPPGHPDFVAHNFKTALILDWKSGFLEVDPAATNDQLRCYCLGVHEELLIDDIYVAIIDRQRKLNICHYDVSTLELARKDIDQVLAACKEPDAPLFAHIDHCRYCKALPTCPAASAVQGVLERAIPRDLSESQFKKMWEDCRLVETKIKAIKQHIYFQVQMAEADNRKIEGVRMKRGRRLRVITDSEKVEKLLEDVIPQSVLRKCSTMRATALDTAFALAKKIPLEKARRQMTKLLEQNGILDYEESRPSLEIDGKDGFPDE